PLKEGVNDKNQRYFFKKEFDLEKTNYKNFAKKVEKGKLKGIEEAKGMEEAERSEEAEETEEAEKTGRSKGGKCVECF
ncbi:24133_t:CDS:2, partial [Gigaspora margarita]